MKVWTETMNVERYFTVTFIYLFIYLFFVAWKIKFEDRGVKTSEVKPLFWHL